MLSTMALQILSELQIRPGENYDTFDSDENSMHSIQLKITKFPTIVLQKPEFYYRLLFIYGS